MFKLMAKKIITILRLKCLLNWPYVKCSNINHSFFFSVVQAADDNAGVIAASAVAAFLVLVAFTAITIYCFYK